MDRADIAAAFVRSSHAPIKSDDLVSDGVYVIRCMEVGELVWKQLSNA